MIKQYLLLIFLVSIHYKLSDSSPENESLQEGRVRDYSCTTEMYPFMVKVEMKNDKKCIVIGAGTMIGPNSVLTSGLVTDLIYLMRESVCRIISSPDHKDGDFLKVNVIANYTHPSGDIAVLKLQKKLFHIQLATLPGQDFVDFALQCGSLNVMGFGPTQFDQHYKKIARTLQCSFVSPIPSERCQKIANMVLSGDRHFCFRIRASDIQRSLNNIDYGGPLFCVGYQVGIIGRFDPQDPKGLVVNFKVQHYLDFIQKNSCTTIYSSSILIIIIKVGLCYTYLIL
ncbi:unnamed protein product [Ceutorhynchus assimilis]|uniref:Peptidase S1 domain-containing protein n=1 Tax=Ceutorhynchus assimilis TaxID=467358 RepID=A0A9N9MVD6_9CUCU|nr:unnamed protein product [Ceutorhynchus assimilis]